MFGDTSVISNTKTGIGHPEKAVVSNSPCALANDFADIENSKLVVLFGNNPCETKLCGGSMQYYFNEALQRGGAKLIVIDPRFTDTAANKAQQWVPIRPATDAALVAGLAYVMIKENLVDQKFLDKYCVGFDKKTLPHGAPKNGSYKDYILGTGGDNTPKTPQWASDITGVPVSTIVELAKEIGTTKPVHISQGWGPQRNTNGEQISRAICTLAAMTGCGRAHSSYWEVPAIRELNPQEVWIHPQDAAKKGVKHGDMVELFNDRGKLRTRAKVTKRVMPGVLALGQGAWYRDKNGVDIGCRTCQMACKDYKDTDIGVNFRRVYEYEGGEWFNSKPNIFAYYTSISCNHCDNPSCVKACPTGAMHKGKMGIVAVDQERCIGCKACAMACPYGAPQFDPVKKRMSKCNGCRERLEQDKKPICVESCPFRALDAGDIKDLRAKYGNVAGIAPLPDANITKPNLCIRPSVDSKPAGYVAGELLAPNKNLEVQDV
ncbi:UNVERIFIED_CONTAM: hypothetical protein PYX00_011069 [Menopon gallinae]|uniref:4Fe-4S ferredoxin-type domain-containing protein n=1 Tax=Menopon gallinae TaxID=328185 RepID=A0AAW2H5Q4_9NEOP